MRLVDIDAATVAELDGACEGLFSNLKEHCAQHGYEAHLTVQTHLEGLPEGEMKLYIQIVGGMDTLDYAVATLGGNAKVIGWNLYLHDTMASAKASITRATSAIEDHEPRVLH